MQNAVFQRRNRRTNARLIFAPCLFILLLYGIQQAVNHVFGGEHVYTMPNGWFGPHFPICCQRKVADVPLITWCCFRP